jgi:hypothetical protein
VSDLKVWVRVSWKGNLRPLNNLTPGYNLQVALMERRIGDVQSPYLLVQI